MAQALFVQITCWEWQEHICYPRCMMTGCGDQTVRRRGFSPGPAHHLAAHRLMEEGVNGGEVAHMQEAAQLSQPQRARLLSLRATLLQDIDRITCERRSIMGGIKASLPPLTGGALSRTSAYCSTCHAHA